LSLRLIYIDVDCSKKRFVLLLWGKIVGVKSFVFLLRDKLVGVESYISSVTPIHVYSHFLLFKMCNAPKSVILGMKNIWIAVVSEIWSHRNNLFLKVEF